MHPKVRIIPIVLGIFGYTYGSFKIEGADKPDKNKTGSYVRMWERRADGTWFVAVDVM